MPMEKDLVLKVYSYEEVIPISLEIVKGGASSVCEGEYCNINIQCPHLILFCPSMDQCTEY